MTVRYSVAVDEGLRFQRQTVGWLLTALELGGVTADQILVQCTGSVPDEFRRRVADVFGVEVVSLPGCELSRGTLNKLHQLLHPALDADWIVLCDCDTVFAEPLPSDVFRPGINAKLVDVGFPGLKFWTELLARFGLTVGQPCRAERGGALTYRNNCNGGLYVGDRGHWARLGPEWLGAADALPALVSVPPTWTRHFDQIALGVACAKLDIDVRLLPSRFNFPFHEDPQTPLSVRPAILHHHQSLEHRRLRCQPGHAMCPGVMSAVDRVDGVLGQIEWGWFGLGPTGDRSEVVGGFAIETGEVD